MIPIKHNNTIDIFSKYKEFMKITENLKYLRNINNLKMLIQKVAVHTNDVNKLFGIL